mmetsp:Transcript_4448/g.11692  ORF Transcript_4448/g.11692 Transcript_4448/m.11692 type:complete len:224 (-) Transcript_4448:20-691(-)
MRSIGANVRPRPSLLMVRYLLKARTPFLYAACASAWRCPSSIVFLPARNEKRPVSLTVPVAATSRLAAASASSSTASSIARVLSEIVLLEKELAYRRIGPKNLGMAPPLFLPSGSSSRLIDAQSLFWMNLRRPPDQKSRPRSMRGTYRVYACWRVTSVDSAKAGSDGAATTAAAAAAVESSARRLTGAATSSCEARGVETTAHERRPVTGVGGSTSASAVVRR